jgi:catechol 2,3-dioxygenase-like lactoylglutathione lyase family enzyme
MPIRAIDHVQLAMPAHGEDAARAFYSGLLGIPERPKPAHLARRGGCWFERDGLKVHLGVEADFRPARKAHPAFLVENLAVLLDRLRAAGCGLSEDEPLKGYSRAYVEDPFGNRIELMEPDASPAVPPDASE